MNFTSKCGANKNSDDVRGFLWEYGEVSTENVKPAIFFCHGLLRVASSVALSQPTVSSFREQILRWGYKLEGVVFVGVANCRVFPCCGNFSPGEL